MPPRRLLYIAVAHADYYKQQSVDATTESLQSVLSQVQLVTPTQTLSSIVRLTKI